MSELITTKGEYVNFNIKNMEYNVPVKITVGEQVYDGVGQYGKWFLRKIIFQGQETTAFIGEKQKSPTFNHPLNDYLDNLQGQEIEFVKKEGKTKTGKSFMYWCKVGDEMVAKENKPTITVSSGLSDTEKAIVEALKEAKQYDNLEAWKGTFNDQKLSVERAEKLFNEREK